MGNAMSNQAVLLPLLVQVALTFAIGFWMAFGRVAAIRSRTVHPREIALREANWPPHLMQLQNAFLNQFEMPILFYALTILVLITKTGDLLFVVPAWVFVGLRFAHAYVHVTSNRVPRRGLLFLAGAGVLCAMWIVFAVRIMAAT
jgi:hypothetical protein